MWRIVFQRMDRQRFIHRVRGTRTKRTEHRMSDIPLTSATWARSGDYYYSVGTPCEVQPRHILQTNSNLLKNCTTKNVYIVVVQRSYFSRIRLRLGINFSIYRKVSEVGPTHRTRSYTTFKSSLALLQISFG